MPKKNETLHYELEENTGRLQDGAEDMPCKSSVFVNLSVGVFAIVIFILIRRLRHMR